MEIIIPVYKPLLVGNEKKYVNECLDSTWISSKGKFITLFEEAFSRFVDISYSTSVCNGTVALHLALVALGIGPGDEVIVPTLTYIASVNAIVYTGATPVFVDSLQDSWQIDPNDVKRKITNRTKAVMAVHLYGLPCNILLLKNICDQSNLFLIEDCAEAFGSKYRGLHVGTFGHVSTFSFFGNKTITTGEGGMVVTNDKYIYKRLVHYKAQGISKEKLYWHDVIGYNYRMTNIAAAIGLAQLEQSDAFISRKKEIAKMYQKGLKGTLLQFHDGDDLEVEHSYWMCSILVPQTNHRDLLREYLMAKGIETRPLFYPVHTMPMYACANSSFPIADDIGSRGINLPSYPSLKNDEINYIIDTILEFSNDYYRSS